MLRIAYQRTSETFAAEDLVLRGNVAGSRKRGKLSDSQRRRGASPSEGTRYTRYFSGKAKRAATRKPATCTSVSVASACITGMATPERTSSSTQIHSWRETMAFTCADLWQRVTTTDMDNEEFRKTVSDCRLLES